jgi:hypothetical protein
VIHIFGRLIEHSETLVTIFDFDGRISGVIQYGKNFLVIWRSSEAVICSGYDLPDDLSRLA